MVKVPQSVKSSMVVAADKLRHISFNGKLEGVWDPEFNQKPDENPPEESTDEGEPWPYPEPNLARISVAPTLEGCFRGVYPNVWKLFEGRKQPYMQFSVYQPIFEGDERVVLPQTLIDERLVWDAAAVGEYLILDKVYMKHVGVIHVLNTESSPSLKIHPFNDKKLPLTTAGPRDIKIVQIK
jgi:hypothetical protein